LPLPELAVVLGSLGGLSWLLAAQYDQLGRAIAGVGHAKLGLIAAAIGCERVSMFAFARMQRRLIRDGDQRLTLASMVHVIFASNALSVSVPMAGPGLGAAFTYRELGRHQVSRAAAAFALVASGALSTVSLMVIMAGGALASGYTVAGALGLLGAAVVVAGIAGTVLGLRGPACRRLLERMAVSGVRVAQRLRHEPGAPPEAVVAEARLQLAGLHLRQSDWAVAAALAFLKWLGDAACLALSTRAVGLDIPVRDLLLVWSAGLVAASLGLTPGGVGIIEVALVATMVGIGVPAAGAAVAVLIYRLISLWLILLVGWIFYVFIRSRRSRRAPMRAESPSSPPSGTLPC
jgi:hypothetical protein